MTETATEEALWQKIRELTEALEKARVVLRQQKDADCLYDRQETVLDEIDLLLGGGK